MKNLIIPFFISFVFFVSCTAEKGPLPVKKAVGPCDTIIHYSVEITSIVYTNCAISGCHVSGSANGDFTTYAGLNAKVANGSLLNRVVTLKTMPASGPLPDAEISRINCWIQQGAPNN